MAEKAKNYEQLQAELSEIIAWFEGDDVSLEQATEKYQEALKLIKQMEIYLSAAENKIKKISSEN